MKDVPFTQQAECGRALSPNRLLKLALASVIGLFSITAFAASSVVGTVAYSRAGSPDGTIWFATGDFLTPNRNMRMALVFSTKPLNLLGLLPDSCGASPQRDVRSIPNAISGPALHVDRWVLQPGQSRSIEAESAGANDPS